MAKRERGFKIGCFHGKLLPENGASEAKLRNDLYLIGRLKLNLTRSLSHVIRVIAYEMPLETGQSRGKCIDLFGYDQQKTPYIIELKKDSSNENITSIIQQINNYEMLFRGVKPYIEAEIQQKYHWSDFQFAEGIGKVIVAHRSFYRSTSLENYQTLGIYLCSFSAIQGVSDMNGNVSLLERFGSKGCISLAIRNK